MKLLLAIPLIFLLGCSGEDTINVEIQDPVVETLEPPAPPPPPPPPVTVVSDELYCDEYTLVQETTYSDGTNEIVVVEELSEECGYVPPVAYGTPLSEPYCANNIEETFTKLLNTIQNLGDFDKVQDFADGEGGSYTDVVEQQSTDCGYTSQMKEPTSCLPVLANTGHPWYDYVNCDGQPQRTNVNFPYEFDDTSIAYIDVLFVVDTKLTDEDRDGLSVQDFVQREVDFTNQKFKDSDVYIELVAAAIQEVEVGLGDLREQYRNFFYSKKEFANLDRWQTEANADFAFLLKKREDNPIACGVAQLDATRELESTRGISQCFQNTIFQESDVTRYYERAPETITHEFGHILGLEHAFGDHQGSGSIFEYSFGYIIPGTEQPTDDGGMNTGYGTIMSYSDLPTGTFSNPDKVFELPNGTTKRTGTDGGCFCLKPIEEQPMPTNAVESLNRVRYTMSQLSENNYSSSPAFAPTIIEQDPRVCLF